MLLQLLTSTVLLLAPPSAPPPSAEPPEQSSEFIAALEYLMQVDNEASSDPVAASAELVQALAALADFAPEVAASPAARELCQLARLNLARAYLLSNAEDRATQAMDEAVREAMDVVLPADMFGPSLAKLYAERVEALEQLGRANLLVTCAKPCTIYVNETALEPDTSPRLLLGRYRVWVEDPTGELPRLREVVELSEAEEIYEVRFAPVLAPPPVAPPPPKPKRIMPRGAEIVVMVVGAGLLATGSALMVLNNEKLDVGPMIGGVVALAFGAGTLTTGMITLSVDERRLARGRAHQATLGWTMRF